MPGGSFKDLKVWQRSRELTTEVYEMTRGFPREELYGLTNQMRRAAVSIPSNIAEGHRRGTDKEFTQFLLIARGSLGELETQVIVSTDLRLMPAEVSRSILSGIEEIGKMLNGLINSLR